MSPALPHCCEHRLDQHHADIAGLYCPICEERCMTLVRRRRLAPNLELWPNDPQNDARIEGIKPVGLLDSL